RKPFQVGLYKGLWRRKEDGATAGFFGINPRYRANDRLTISGNLNWDKNTNGKGYVNRNDNTNQIFFGNREVETITSELRLQYTFTNKMGLSLRSRNYWSRVEYNKFFDLQDNGTLVEGSYTGLDEGGLPLHDKDFTVFNLDLIYSWQIAPGSFLNVTYKQQTSNSDVIVRNDYFRNLSETLDIPGSNTVSVKLIYYLDYATLFGT
ncbi:MAG: DUF5916 domain-containing protein, partial [Cyclobacteriaceae bacterium]|nr:DUF5916 domain-containing protein [Cyclobacteriaceae bacterium]